MKFAAILAALIAVTATYHITVTKVVGGDGGWDYLTYDTASKRLFVSRSTHVMVLDPAGNVVGDIPNTPGVHGIAIANDLGKGFTSNGRDASVTVFDLASLKTLATVKVDTKNPDGITYDPVSHRVFTFNGGSNDASVIDAKTNTVVATIPLGGRPEFPAVDGKGIVYDNIESTNEIVAIDAASAKIVKRFPLAGCDGPSGLSMDQAHRRLFAACSGQMGIVDADSGKVVALVPTGAGTDATRFDPKTGNAFAPNGRDATLTVVHEDDPDHFSISQNAKTVAGARTMELDPATGAVFLVTAQMTQSTPAPGDTRPRFVAVPGTFEFVKLEL